MSQIIRMLKIVKLHERFLWGSAAPSVDKNVSYFLNCSKKMYELPDKHVNYFIFIFFIVKKLLNFKVK